MKTKQSLEDKLVRSINGWYEALNLKKFFPYLKDFDINQLHKNIFSPGYVGFLTYHKDRINLDVNTEYLFTVGVINRYDDNFVGLMADHEAVSLIEGPASGDSDLELVGYTCFDRYQTIFRAGYIERYEGHGKETRELGEHIEGKIFEGNTFERNLPIGRFMLQPILGKNRIIQERIEKNYNDLVDEILKYYHSFI